MSQKLVLVGGGHAQAIALRLWGLDPVPGIDLSLISDVAQTPYSGMLPGHVAGFYSYEETHIDLVSLAEFAGAKFIGDRAIGLDLACKRVICSSQEIDYDYLSLDIGSTPQAIDVPGAQKYAIPAKPVPGFLAAWNELKELAATNPPPHLSLVIVGGGAGGVELALNIQTCLQEILPATSLLELHLIHRGQRLLPGHNDWVSRKLSKIVRQRSIKLHLQQNVTQVLADRIICQSGLEITGDRVFWVTQAAAPEWLKKSPLTTDSRGFILVQQTLQSVSHPDIFAAGDIATMLNYPRPKAGVFAVRQGKPLVENWRRILTGEPLVEYTPQAKYLALIGTGDKKAIVSWANLGWRSSLFWLWKDYLDRQFMGQFKEL